MPLFRETFIDRPVICMHIRSGTLLSALLLLCLLLPGTAGAATIEVHLLRYADDGITLIEEKTVDYRWMENNLPVLGDGKTHYFHQGPVFYGDAWNPTEDTNVQEKDMGAVKGTDLADLCDLVGGMEDGEIVRVKAADGFSKTFPYRNVYEPEARQGPMVVTWYRADDGYVPDYREGMRLVFFADTSVNPWGLHIFGVADMQECFDPDYWYFFQPEVPTTTGLSAQYISEIAIFSNEEATGTLEVESGPAGALVYLDDENTGLLTPCTIRDLETGSHSVRVVKEGYSESPERWIDLKAFTTEEVSFNLVPLQGSIAVSSLPAGALILLDGNETGAVTDTTLEGVSVGEHTLVLVLDEYENATLTVTVEAAEAVVVDLPLVPLNRSETVPEATAGVTFPATTTPAATPGTTAPAVVVTTTAPPPPGPFDPFLALFRAIVAFITGVPDEQGPRAGTVESSPAPPTESGPATVTPTPVRAPETVPSNRTGGLYIDSFPQGAAITIDNTRIGAHTPYLAYGLREGLHSISLEYEVASSVDPEEAGVHYGICRAWVYPDAVTPVHLDGVENRRLRSIIIEDRDRAGAAFTVNGVYPVYIFPTTVDIEGSGAWITIREDAVYRSIPVPDTLVNGSRFAAIPGDDGLYSIGVVSSPAGARVFVDGYPTDATTPAVVGNLSSGRHRITVSLPGYLPAGGEVAIPKGAPEGAAGTIQATLIGYPWGSLSVDSTPQGAKIYLYGRYTGEKTPCTFPWMRIGTYSVKVAGDTASTTVENIVVAPGTTVECTAELEDR